MDNNTLNKRMIQSIVKKAVENIHENPERQIRNLTDLGSMLAKGKYQKQFFDAAEKELAQENSLYYKVATGLIQKTDSDILLTVGTNLGYNSLTYGAKKIRGFEEISGFNVPWTLLLEISEGGRLGVDEIERLITQGEAMGIYSYLFIVKSGYSELDAFCKMLNTHKECVFMLLVPPDMLDEKNEIDALRGKTNILIGLDIGASDEAATRKATKLLREEKFMCAAFCWAEGSVQKSIKKATQKAAEFGYEIIVIMQDYNLYVGNPEAYETSINEIRAHLDIPAVPLDILSDIVMVDRAISTEGCLAIVLENGDIYITNMETLEQDISHNVIDSPLEEIFGEALKKQST